MILVRLSDDEVLHIDVEPKVWQSGFERALRADTALEVEGPDGRVLGINPQRVLYWEECPAPAPFAAIA
jgi:hypothetical protein